MSDDAVDAVLLRDALAMHKAAIARMLELAPALAEAFAADPIVSSALLVHGLHPVAAETRVRRALAEIRGAELLSLEGDVAIVRARTPADESAIDAALCEAAPDVVVRVERVDVPLDRLRKHARCDFCDATVAATHEHTLDPKTRTLRCACQACSQLFRRVTPRAERLHDFRMSDATWDALRIPIDLAFFYESSATKRVVAAYPGPAGATESTLALEGWTSLRAENTVLQELAPDVEALLVHRAGGARAYYRVSIDRCYELVGIIRRDWRGFSGGDRVWSAVRAFFDSLEASCRS